MASVYKSADEAVKHYISRWQSTMLVTTALVPCFFAASAAQAGPVGGVVTHGNATISQASTLTTINQVSDRAVLDWQSFNIGAAETTRFVQPSGNSVAVNRVHDVSASTIAGTLTANGHVVITNPNGVMFTKDAKVDVGGLTVSTASVNDIDAASFVGGTRSDLPLTVAGNPNAKILNAGTITAKEAGLVGLVAPNVENSGIIRANKGRVTLASGDTATLDLYGDGLVSLAMSTSTQERLVANAGMVEANGGTVLLTAASASDVANAVISVEGTLQANTIDTAQGKIILKSDQGVIQVTGDVRTNGDATKNAGSITATGRFVALGGKITANGKQGGRIDVTAGNTLSLADRIEAKGLTQNGGSITLKSDGVSWETSTSSIHADGAMNGGTIRHTATGQLMSSGHYSANGAADTGGSIDVTAFSAKFLSATFDARGKTHGGRVRLGGEYQGGKSQADGADELKNADYLVVDAGTKINVSSTGVSGNGGTAILWSDITTLALGNILATPGTSSGNGGFVEISSAGELQYKATVQTGIGSRAGTVLLDPKNIIIASASFNPTAIIMGYGYGMAGSGTHVSVPGLPDNPTFGQSLSLNGNRVVVGAYTADSADQSVGNVGAVYLYSFTDSSFSGGKLEGVIGKGYTGGKNMDVANLGSTDQFGYSVSLDGNNLAVSAIADDGLSNNRSDAGAVYIFSFADATFSSGNLVSTIGFGYNGAKDLNLNGYLEVSDTFGRSVSLNGTNIAIGAMGDDGTGNAVINSGAVYLISFADSAFNSPTLKGRIGAGYNGAGDYNLALDASDQFGLSVSLNGTRLAVGANQDDGYLNSGVDTGAVYLFSFANAQLSTPVLHSIMGSGYTGGNNVNMALDASDGFGRSVSLEGNQLAIGAIGDDGVSNNQSAAGAVYLFSLDPSLASAPTQQAIIGHGYTGGKNVNLTLDSGDNFGIAIGLNNNRLAIAAQLDDGFSNFASNAGGVYLYSFTDSNFNGVTLQARIGSGYVGAKDIDTKMPGANMLGSAVALEGNLLAIGAYGDAGFSNTKNQAGAVYLYSFADNDFNGVTFEGIIGSGYTGGKNYNISLDVGDQFGSSLSLDNGHLAIGARFDDGFNNTRSNAGAVYLFKFTDNLFSGASLESTIGHGYTGGKNYNISLDVNDYFGVGLAMDGGMLAIGVYGDDGISNGQSAAGAVKLFTFTGDYSSIALQGTIGFGYAGAKDYNLALDASDQLGWGIALQNNRLAITALGDDGYNNIGNSTGAVYLFTFTNNLFAGASLVSTIGYGYTGGNNVNITTLDTNDTFGRSVALEGTTLVVGAHGDDGDPIYTATTSTNQGAVYLLGFNTLGFAGGRVDGIIGDGYRGGKNIDLGGNSTSGTSALGGGDQFGTSVALDNGRLIVGAGLDDGYSNWTSDAGAVYLIRSNAGTDVSAGAAFSSNSTGTQGLTPDSIAALLSTPQNVILQASNDITLLDHLTVNNPSGNGGTLTLQAGRSIIINGLITSDNGNVNLYANEKNTAGVVTANRDVGAANITFGANGAINAGTGTVTIRLDDGAGRSGGREVSGDITLGAITAGNLLVSSAYQYSNLILNGIVTASGTGNAITLAPGGSITNNAGASALQLTGGGRWLLYSDHPILNSLGGLTAQEQYNCAYGSCTGPASGNALLYQYGEHLLRIGVNATRQYGDTNPTIAELQAMLVISGYLPGEGWADIDVKPTWSIASSATATAAAGTTHAITFSGGSDATYSLYYDQSFLTVAKKDITAVWNAALSKTYGDANPAVGNGNFTFSGLANGELGTVITATADFGAVTAATGAGSYNVGALFTALNYNVTNATVTTLTIAKKDITATWTGGLTKTYGDANPSVSSSDFTFSGLVNGDLGSAITSSANFGSIGQYSNAATYTNGVTGLFNAANYTVTNAPTTNLVINKRILTAGLTGTTSKTYDALTAAALTSANYTLTNIVNSDDVNLASFLNGTYANKNAASGKTVTVTGLSLTGTKASNYQLASTSINAAIGTIQQKALSITGISAVGKTYDGLLGATLSGSGTLVGKVGTDVVTLNAAGATGNYGDKHVGTNKAVTVTGYTLGGTDAGNYTLTQPTGLTATILAKALTISGISAANKYYDGGMDVLLSGTASLVGTIGGDAIGLDSTSVDARFADKHVGTNKAVTISGYTLNGADAGNYTLTQPGGLLANIVAKTIHVVLGGTVSKTYDGTTGATLSAGNYSLNGAIVGDTISLTGGLAGIYADKDAGTGKTVSVNGLGLTGADASNYVLSSNSVNGAVGVINRANLIVSAASGLSKIYGNTDPGFTYSYTGLVGGDSAASFTGSLARSAGENVGFYTLGLGSLAATGNYTIASFNPVNFAITKRAITAVVLDASRVYGDANPLLNWSNVTWSNLANGDTGAVIDNVGFAFGGAGLTSNAGSNYAISISGFTDNNYTLSSSSNGSLNITKANLLIKPNDVSSFSGQPIPVFTAQYLGLKNGEGAAVVHGLKLSSDAGIGSVGSFSILGSEATATNYAISYAPGTLTMLPATTLVPESVQQGRITNTIQRSINAITEKTPVADLLPQGDGPAGSRNTTSNAAADRYNSAANTAQDAADQPIHQLSELVRIDQNLQRELQ